MTLCSTFRELSYQTWSLLSKARAVRSQIGEETLTDLNLLELKLHHSAEVKTRTFTKPAEARSGADWEWWFTGQGQWLGFRIQAKVLELDTDTFPHLHYRNSRDYQSNILITSSLSAEIPMIPMYCMYLQRSDIVQDHAEACGSFGTTPESYGISLLSAFEVLRFRPTVGLTGIWSSLRPWHCLPCCSGFSSRGRSLPGRVLDFWKATYLRQDRRIDLASMGELSFDYRNLFQKYENVSLVEKPPAYVEQVFHGETLEHLEGIEGLRTVTVFQEEPRAE